MVLHRTVLLSAFPNSCQLVIAIAGTPNFYHGHLSFVFLPVFSLAPSRPIPHTPKIIPD